MECTSIKQFQEIKLQKMSNKLNYAGLLPDTKDFCLKYLTPKNKQIAIEKVNGILDNLDEIQSLLGNKEYVKQIAHWQAVKNAIENEF